MKAGSVPLLVTLLLCKYEALFKSIVSVHSFSFAFPPSITASSLVNPRYYVPVRPDRQMASHQHFSTRRPTDSILDQLSSRAVFDCFCCATDHLWPIDRPSIALPCSESRAPKAQRWPFDTNQAQHKRNSKYTTDQCLRRRLPSACWLAVGRSKYAHNQR